MPFAAWSKIEAMELLATIAKEQAPVLICLQALQSHFGYIPAESIALVAQACNVSRAEVHGVFTYYHDLRSEPSPQILIRLCVAEACQSVGSRELVKAAEEKFGTVIGQVKEKIEIEAAYCFGNCALGPSATVNNKLIGRANIHSLASAVEKVATP